MMIGNTRKFLIVLSILAMQYCSVGATVLTVSSRETSNGIANNIITYVKEHPTESALTITFEDTIPSTVRTAILNKTFSELAKENLTQQITTLNLSDNRLTKPPVVTGFSALQLLDLAYNKLDVPPVLTGLSDLQNLLLSNNQLTSAPNLAGLSELKWLDLSDNQLAVPPVLTDVPPGDVIPI
ncbi:hypothetical protein M1466_01360 [Candidatus Dependentiae bacterium]|nr:hypothetical protein [Candidatus Dependentiae bacterium]